MINTSSIITDGVTVDKSKPISPDESTWEDERCKESDVARSKVVVFDTETTGLSSSAELVSVGWAVIENDAVTEYGQEFVAFRNIKVWSEEAQRVHNITPQFLRKNGITKTAVLSNFNKLISDATMLVCHNITFDVRIMTNAMQRCGIESGLADVPRFCTLNDSRNKYGRRFRLGDCFDYSYSGTFNAHDALADSIATALVYRSRNRLTNTDELLKLIEYTPTTLPSKISNYLTALVNTHNKTSRQLTVISRVYKELDENDPLRARITELFDNTTQTTPAAPTKILGRGTPKSIAGYKHMDPAKLVSELKLIPLAEFVESDSIASGCLVFSEKYSNIFINASLDSISSGVNRNVKIISIGRRYGVRVHVNDCGYNDWLYLTIFNACYVKCETEDSEAAVRTYVRNTIVVIKTLFDAVLHNDTYVMQKLVDLYKKNPELRTIVEHEYNDEIETIHEYIDRTISRWETRRTEYLDLMKDLQL